ncbi:MAG: ABC transporter ATP-binding protein [Paludibacteraceae bacterium]|jgi:ATP-binding cassette subfamily B protein/subfamily B ATP-binding cassette protein MsbA|nr:ABC transporter ATP-binding protein [Paludibacteraceae bacterium]
MKDFVRIFTRFLPKYKGCVVANVICYILTTIFSLFSFGTIIPILQILFGMETASHEYMTWTFADSFKYIVDALKNNLFFYIEDYIRTYGGANTMLILGVFMIFMTFLKTGTAYLAGYFMIPIRFGVLRDIRMDLYNKILSLPMGFYSEERKGDIMARMTNDVTEVGTSIMTSLEAIFKNPIMIIIYFSVMIAISWELTLFILVMLPIVGVIIGRVGKSLKTRSMLGQTQQGSLLSIIEETLGGLRIIKAFNAEKKASSRFEQLNTTVMNTFNKIERRYILAHPVSEFLGTAIIVIVLWYGGTLILSENANTISAPAFIYYLVIFYSLINPCKELSKAVYTIQRGLASLARVDVILGAENVIKEKENPTQIEAFKDEISFNNVSFKYQSDWVLKDISLKIKKGQMVALVGQSGSGKSTMVDLIPRFYDVQKGSVTIDGIDVRDVRTYDLRALMGNVNQEAILFNDTFYNNITFGVENPTMEEVIAAAKIANAHDFIMASESGYETNIGDRGSKLSGGQRQRVSIARAILKNPPILILDEATSALDTESEKLVQEAIDNLMKNRTSIVVAHRLSTIKNADLICVMNEGRIVELGKHEELILKDGYYKRLCDMQSF